MLLELNTYNLARPEKINWTFNFNNSVLDSIKSKTLRKFLRTSSQILNEQQITYEYVTLDKNAFVKWLSFYKEIMNENQYKIIADDDWYDKKMAENKIVKGLFFYKYSQLIGSGIATTSESEKKGVLAFKASKKVALSSSANSSLGAIIDYYFLEEMIKEGMDILSGGKSTNAFNAINSLGYLDYKLRFGFLPSTNEEAPLLSMCPLGVDGVVVFYGIHALDKKEGFFAFKPKNTAFNFESARFNGPDLNFTIIEY